MSFTFEDERQYNMAEDRRLAAKGELDERRDLRMNAADLAWGDCPKLHREIYAKSEPLGWKVSNQNIDGDVFRLALGSLPSGWEDNGVWYSCTTQFGYANHDTMQVRFDDWPGAVRSGQAEIAGRLLAAHVELERRKVGAK